METNLDLKCAEYGNKIITQINQPEEKKKIESTITKALGVLQEDGVYAFSIYTKSKSGDKSTEKITAKMMLENSFELLKEVLILQGNDTELCAGIRSRLADNLDQLLFAKELLERTLIYARYHAKALGEE